MNDVAVYRPRPVAPRSSELDDLTRFVTNVAATRFVPEYLRGNSEEVLACVLHGRELGLGPMQSLSKVYMLDGSPTLAAETMRAMVRQAGHDLWPVKLADDEVVLAGRRANWPEDRVVTVSWDLDRALHAGLIQSIGENGRPIARTKSGRPMPWEQYPRALLMARATSELCRYTFEDVLGGLSYTPEELGADVVEVAEDGTIVEYGLDLDDDPRAYRERLLGRYREAISVVLGFDPSTRAMLDEDRRQTLAEVVTCSPDSQRAFFEGPLDALRGLVDRAEAAATDTAREFFEIDDAVEEDEDGPDDDEGTGPATEPSPEPSGPAPANLTPSEEDVPSPAARAFLRGIGVPDPTKVDGLDKHTVGMILLYRDALIEAFEDVGDVAVEWHRRATRDLHKNGPAGFLDAVLAKGFEALEPCLDAFLAEHKPPEQ